MASHGPFLAPTVGAHYRLVVALKYSAQIAFIRFVGTHAAYDKDDVEEV
jgi:mRNA interferase HigB